jgi:adenylate cyclase
LVYSANGCCVGVIACRDVWGDVVSFLARFLLSTREPPVPELIAVGPEPQQRWRRQIPSGETIRLGRAPRIGWAVPWDRHISREHAELSLVNKDQLKVRRLDVARNYISYQGNSSNEFTLLVGEEFRIGITSFYLADVEVSETEDEHVEEHSFRRDELTRFSFRNSGHRLEVLSGLPRLIAEAAGNEDLAIGLVDLLLQAIPYAGAAAVLQYPMNSGKVDAAEPIMLRWDTRDIAALSSSGEHGRFRPSRRLIMRAIESSGSVLHVWGDADDTDPAYTTSGKFDWAFCTPITDEASKGWCLYVSGQFGFGLGSSARIVSEDELRGDLRFAEMVAQFVGASRRAQMLEKQQAGLANFFSPAVLEMIRHSNASEVLEPKETEITSLFCDVRGFSRKAERAQKNLKELLDQVSGALGVMTCGILKYDGVIADFQGDAALGFWGWPAPTEEGPLSACLAALEIHQEFVRAREKLHDPRAGFQVGIGIAHGRAIAGKIGTNEQVKVGVFGPVVNMSARLEGMTRQLRVPILIDEMTADAVRQSLPPENGRCRPLGRIRPYGMDVPLMVSELLPPENFPGTITNDQIRVYEEAVDAVIEGRWEDALEFLDSLPVKDRAKDFLIIYMAQNDYEPPENWDGVIDMSTK